MIASVSLPGFDQIEPPQPDKISTCIHCGLCLDKCPTYRTLGTEMDSPRGRVYLIKAVEEERLAMTPSFVDHMYLCLDCRACETACPSHVEFGDLMERARGQIERQLPRSRLERVLRHLVFVELFPHPKRMEWLFKGLRLYERSGIRAFLHDHALLDLLPKRLGEMEAMLPPLPPRSFTGSTAEVVKGREPVTRRVGFFVGCVMNHLNADVHHASSRVLQANGCDVWAAAQQVCCGALHMHAGEREQARELARRNIDAFEQQSADAIINNAAGCGAQLKTYGELLAEDPAYAERAQDFSARVQDISEFLAQEPLRGPLGPVPKRVAYDDPCHLLHAQQVREPPRHLLQQIPELDLVPFTDADFCCGAAGIYNLTQPDMSMRILESKMEHIRVAEPDVIATGNPGCMMQLRSGVQRAGLNIPVVHPITLIDDAYQAGS
ncbi:MAG: heterodisulfide reductase-related iron-sulfur binding cluster [Candidatus Tectomicrobia bacterium]|nr:heterodisulfide reductase-related iron-sulfur binding cluster [Candidatus Tectomicrobia bacterium]